MKHLIALLLLQFAFTHMYGSVGDTFTVMNGDGSYSITYRITSEMDNSKSVYVGTKSTNSAISTSIEGVVTIPSTVRYKNANYSVIGIGDNAFSGCTNITGVILPEGISFVGEKAFYNCTSLISLELPNVTNIGREAFLGCTSLSYISIPNVTYIRDFAFRECTSLTSMVYPVNINYVGSNIFYHGSEPNLLYTSDLDALVRSFCNLGKIVSACRIFVNNVEVIDVVIPNDVTTIRDGSFYGCSSLKTIVIPEAVTSIGNHAFYGCSSLTSITIPKGVTSIGNFAFSGCNSLYEIILPESVNTIGTSAFSDCKNLKNVTIQGPVISIENRTFHSCTSLETVSIAEGLTTIGERAFEGCSNLASVSLPQSLESIGQYAFAECGFPSITLPKNLSTFYGNSILSCSKLMEIHSRIEEPSFNLNSYSLSGVPSSAVLYVPYGKKEIYQTKWSFFTNIVEEPKTGNVFTASIPKEGSTLEGTFMIVNDDPLEVQFGDGTTTSIVGEVEGKLAIPNFVEGYDGTTFSVVGIGDNAFSELGLNKIEIPRQIRIIGDGAFSNCTNLHSVSVNWRKPSDISVPLDCFDDLPNDAALFVPAGTKARYEEEEVWSKFFEIVETSPIYIGDITAVNNSKASLPVFLNNIEEIAGLQFRLTLPEGVSVVEDQTKTTERTTGMTIMCRKDPNTENSYLFVMFSLEGNTITGNEGAIMNVTLNVDEDVSIGQYEMKIDDVYMATLSLETLSPIESTSDLTINDYQLGDVNGDGRISVTDVIILISYVLEEHPENFTFAAADVNSDGKITVTDAVIIIDMILNNQE